MYYHFQKKSEHYTVYKSSDSQHGASYHTDGSRKHDANVAHYGDGYGNKHGAYGNKNAYNNVAGYGGGYYPTSYHNGYGSQNA